MDLSLHTLSKLYFFQDADLKKEGGNVLGLSGGTTQKP
jgi:hypothetical protein